MSRSHKPKPTQFLTTRWTLIGEAVQAGNENAKEAMGDLFGTYWKPLYRYVRRAGKNPEDAEDLVQGFFVHLIEGDGLRLADKTRGRFRAFMLGSLKNYMANEWRREHSQKRGGFLSHLSLDWSDAETGLGLDLEDEQSPDRLFDREWAFSLLDKVLNDLRTDEPEFARWKAFLGLRSERISYAEAAEQFGMSEGAARVAVYRLRKRYRQRVRKEIAETLVDPSMVDDEMKALFSAMTEEL